MVLSCPAKAGHPVIRSAHETRGRCGLLDRPVKPGDDREIDVPANPMHLTIATWNINSVRLRIDSVAKFIKAVRPDVLCLQETKCPDDAFPAKRFKRLGYQH